MFLYKYYLEIKNRFFLTFFSWGVALFVCGFYREILLTLIIKITALNINFYKKKDATFYFIFTDVKELFYVYLKLIFFVANCVCFAFLIYQLFMFFYLGMYAKEYKKLKKIVETFIVVSFVAIITTYVFVIPLSLDFFLSFQHKTNISSSFSFFFEAKISEFFSFVIQTYKICFLSFQFIGGGIFLMNNLITKIKIKKIKIFRKIVYFFFYLFSTLITPPDVISQVILGSGLILIYEIFIFVKIFYFAV